METTLIHALTVFMGFLAMMNPIANTPIFLSLTRGNDAKTTKAVALRSLVIAFMIVVIFAVAGKLIFELFNLTLPAFRITGGLLVFLIGFHMLQGNNSIVQHPSAEDREKSIAAALDVAVSPLAMPILAGPGIITTAMNYSASGDILDVVTTIGAFAILCGITFTCFIFGERFVTYIGDSALGAITRMMGLILAVIGTEMALTGIHGAFNLTTAHP